MNVLELHARHKPRWNGDEWWKPDDFLWKVDWHAENLTTKIDRKGIHGLIKKRTTRAADIRGQPVTRSRVRKKHPDVYATLSSINVKAPSRQKLTF